MTTTPHSFTANHYGPRAQDYLSSEVHRQGADLDQLENELRDHGHARLLDLGCGGGHVSYRVAPLVRNVVACDVTPSMLAMVQATAAERGLSNISVQQAPAEQLPFADASFDVVVARFTTHHWQHRDAGLREARRVLKPSGRAIFIDVVAPEHALLDTHLQAVELLRDVSHVRNYRVPEWIAALALAGFTVDSLTARRLPMRFDDWVARTRTSAEHIAAIRSLQLVAPSTVREHFAIADDGSFMLDTVTLVTHGA
ncbi:methyltransferase domain-containing protein [Dyella halodurans]|uniref:Class I SAM-dependent methyltransferase n=1 Tax=Dyella halodurans TaxID=1920171 RepID=A0ABV9BYZ4_9GAMM|nr:methyltransferase domain-containing protein [Dyella halodurans]